MFGFTGRMILQNARVIACGKGTPQHRKVLAGDKFTPVRLSLQADSENFPVFAVCGVAV